MGALKSYSLRMVRKLRGVDRRLQSNATYRLASSKLRERYYRWSRTAYEHSFRNYATLSGELNIQKNLYLFDSFWGRKVGCNPYAIYRELARRDTDGKYRFIWTKNSNTPAPDDVSNDARVTFVEYMSDEYVRAMLSAEVVIHNSNLPMFFGVRPGQYMVSTWHGFPMKALGVHTAENLNAARNTHRQLNTANLIPLSSQYEIDKLRSAYRSDLAPEVFKITGSPRIDLTVNSDSQDVKRKLGLSGSDKIALFAPTWRGMVGNPSAEIGEQLRLVDLISKSLPEGWVLFTSLHNYTRNALGSSLPNIRHVPLHIDTNEFLSACDILISDYSSIFFDFLPLDRPVILHVPDLESYRSARGLYIEPEELPCSVTRTDKELIAAISEGKLPSQFTIGNAAISALCENADGKASLRVVDLIESRWVPARSSDRKRILVYPGGFLGNGITSSFRNLTATLNYDLYEVFVLINSEDVSKGGAAQLEYERIDARCKVLLTNAPLHFSLSEREVWRKASEDVDDIDRLVIRRAMERTCRHLVGGIKFDVVLDFSGYTRYWNEFLAVVAADRRAVYQHNDMAKEAWGGYKNHRSLGYIFRNYREFDEIVSVSDEVGELNFQQLGDFLRYEQRRVARNVLNAGAVRSQSRAPVAISSLRAHALLSDPDLFCFVVVGRLSQEKGQELAIRAFARVVSSGHRAALILVGSGRARKALEALARQLRVKDYIIFTGQMDNPLGVVAGSDCFVFPSIYEGQGLALLEAMTLGKPCIGADIPVIARIMNDAGLKATPRTEEDFAAAMVEAIEGHIPCPSFDADLYDRQALEEFYAVCEGRQSKVI